jgi:hypothetical protein
MDAAAVVVAAANEYVYASDACDDNNDGDNSDDGKATAGVAAEAVGPAA